MDDLEIRRLYYLILVDARDNVRSDAVRAFADSKDPRLETLAAIGSDIFSVLSGHQKPESIEDVPGRFDGFPMNSFWRTFPETSGQELLKKAQGGGSGKKTLVRLGLELLARSQDGGFLISETSVELVKSVRKEGGELAKSVLDYHAMMKPEKGVPKAMKKAGPKPPNGASSRRST